MPLSDEHLKGLTRIFRLLDAPGRGSIDVEQFRALGEAMTGARPSRGAAAAQLARADLDNNGKLSLDEWLQFGAVLGNLPGTLFGEHVERWCARLEAMQRAPR
jgi:hypothetical protein